MKPRTLPQTGGELGLRPLTNRIRTSNPLLILPSVPIIIGSIYWKARASMNNSELAISDVYDAIVAAPNESFFSIQSILNIIIAHCQQPLCFSVYRRSQSDSSYNKLFNFLTESIYSERIDRAEQQITPPSDSHLFPLFPTSSGEANYYLHVMVVSWINADPSSDLLSQFDSILPPTSTEIKSGTSDNILRSNVNTIIWNILSSGWTWKLSGDFHNMVLRYCNTSIENRMRVLQSQFSRLAQKSFVKERDDFRRIFERSLLPSYKRAIEPLRLLESFSHHTSRHNNNTILYNIPNIFFAIRTFTRESQRFSIDHFSGYDYDVCFVTPGAFGDQHGKQDGQVKDLLDFFTCLGATSATHQNVNYFRNSCNNVPIAAELDDWFWKTIASPDGAETMVRKFRSWIGTQTRSFSDAAFTSGLSQIRFPFEQGGIRRIAGALNAQKLSDLPRDSQEDAERIVSAYYLMAGMAGSLFDPERKEIRLLLTPIEVGGTTWAVAGHLVAAKSTTEVAEAYGVWRRQYQFLTTIKRRIESSMQSALVEINLRWHAAAIDVAMESVSDDSSSNLEIFLKILAHQCEALERTVPYETAIPSLDIGNPSHLLYQEEVSETESVIIPGSIAPNRYFTRDTLANQNYIAEGRIQDAIELSFRRSVEIRAVEDVSGYSNAR